ncbi:MAG: SAP domain-containing protein [Methanobrevibacter sp.]|nr:SAP domain-containing protein [Methanobrevibacter sp.]
MAKNKYITREDGIATIIHSNQEDMYIELKYILSDYKYIKKAVKKENHIFERPYGDFFKEILYENKVVGFAMYELYNNKQILNEIYIMPKFRKYGLFIKELSGMCISRNKPCIYLPRRDMVKALMEEAYAAELEDGIVVSSIEFAFSDDDALCSDDTFFDFDDFYFTPFFDLNINSAFFIENKRLFYNVMNRNDLRKYGFPKHLNESHFNDLRKCINQNIQEIERIIEETESNLPQRILFYDAIVGEGEGLSEYMEGLVKEGFFDRDMAMEIRDILREDYKNGFIDDNEIIPRMAYLNASGSNDRLDSKFEPIELDDALEILDDDELDLIFGDIAEDDFSSLDMGEEEKSKLMDLIENIKNDEEFSKRLKDSFKDDDIDSFSELLFDAAEDAGIDSSFLLKDLDEVVSYDLDVFRVLSTILDGSDFEELKENMELECGMSFDAFAKFLIDDGYLNVIDSNDWNDYSSVYKVEDLKEFLRENDLRLSGKKQDLIDRLNDNNVETKAQVSITYKGIMYLKDYVWIEFYENFLQAFDFNNFYNFYENRFGTLYDISLDFLNRHMEQAVSIDDEDYINDCNMAIKAIKEEGKELLDYLGLE